MVLSVVGAIAFSFTDRLFHGQEVLLVCFVIALGTYAFQHITRGTLSGNGRFGPYGMILGAEGVFRLAPVIVVYLAGVDNLLWYGLALAIPPLLASLVALRGQHGLLAPGPDAEWSELSTNLTLLFLGSLAAQALSYAAALGVLVLAQGHARSRRRRRLHRRLLHRPHPDPAVPGHPGRAAARSWPRSPVPGSIADFRSRMRKLVGDRGRGRRARHRRRAPRSAPGRARSSSATSSTSSHQDLALLCAGARRSSSPSRSRRR